MTTNPNAGALAILGRLSRETRKCSECLGSGGYPGNTSEQGVVTLITGIDQVQTCDTCPGTGQVLVCPGLTKECLGSLIAAGNTEEEYCCDACGWLDGHYIHDEACERCSGAGRVLLTGPALLVAGEECIEATYPNWVLFHDGDGYCYARDPDDYSDFAVFIAGNKGWSHTRLLALARALEAVVEARKGEQA